MEFIQPFLEKLPVIAMWLGYLTIIATVIARVTPSKKDDESVAKYSSNIWSLIQWLPTIGVTPMTKEVKDAYDKISGISR